MTGLQGLFIDFYGTLAGGDREVVELICRAVIDDFGLELSAVDLAEDWGRTYFEAIEAINGDGFRPLVEIEADTLVDTFLPYTGEFDPQHYIVELNKYLARPELFDEVREVLAAKKLPMCLVSNADDRQLREALEYHELSFDYVVSSESARSYKPEPRIFEAALELTGWKPDKVLHVGDSLHSDVWGAHRAGLRAAWVCRSGRISDIGTEKPDFTWSDLRPIISLG
ncbi:MAG: HAD family hydrolase [Planctomycetota bacterium]|nr:MAG: HAD family hydrolase [Planctomycetota bacterium]